MQFNLSGLSVMLAIPTHRDFDPQVVFSLLETQTAAYSVGIDLQFLSEEGSSLAHHARIKVAHKFLNSPCERLFMIDSDIVWKSSDFLKMVALSTVMDVVVGVYPAKREPETIFLGPMPEKVESNEYGCIPISGAGLGHPIVTRKVMEALAEISPATRFPDSDDVIPYSFSCDNDTRGALDGIGYARGEDMKFFSQVKSDLGFEIWCDPSIELGHVGKKVYKASLFDYLSRSD